MGKLERESGLEQASGDDAAALQHKLRLCAHEQSTKLKQRRGSPDSIGHVPGLAQGCHEFAIALWIGRGNVYRSFHILAGDEKLYRVGEIVLVYPGNPLP